MNANDFDWLIAAMLVSGLAIKLLQPRFNQPYLVVANAVLAWAMLDLGMPSAAIAYSLSVLVAFYFTFWPRAS